MNMLDRLTWSLPMVIIVTSFVAAFSFRPRPSNSQDGWSTPDTQMKSFSDRLHIPKDMFLATLLRRQ